MQRRAASRNSRSPMELNVIRCGPAKYQLSGTLKVQFAGRILPHENTKVVLYGDGVSSINGKFERVEMPAGWRSDLEYDFDKPAVVLKNFRPDRAPAFPGAEGFGKYAMGGRGGKSHPGHQSERRRARAVSALRARPKDRGSSCFVFQERFPLESQIKIENPYITIAGQTAPGDGICIRNHGVKFNTRPCDHSLYPISTRRRIWHEYDGFAGQGDQIIIDHCSVSWGIDETFSINKASNLYRAVVHGDGESSTTRFTKKDTTAMADCGAARVDRGTTTFWPTTPAAIRARPGTRNPG